MKVYVFGNQDHEIDSVALNVSRALQNDYPQVQFISIQPNEDLPFADGQDVILMDAIQGINEESLFRLNDLNHLIGSLRLTVHDYDLGFQLKYLQKLGKLGEVQIIGLPYGQPVNYKRIHSIFKKLVAQDMQGS